MSTSRTSWRAGYGPLTPVRSIARADVLDRYVARIDRRREGTLLEDVAGLTIARAAESREALVEQLRAVGWTSVFSLRQDSVRNG